jgi:hypothetical protein
MSQDYKAIRFHEYGGSDKLLLETVPRPVLKADEVLIEVHFAGVNPVDWKIRSGYLKDFMPVALPFIPGIDVSGVVVETGSDVKGIRKGQAAFGIGKGTYAQYALATEGEIVPKPDGLSFEMAATVPVAALTAWKAVADSGAKKGLSVMIQGAAGGVGLFAVQFAALKGAKVIGTASEGLGFPKEGRYARDHRGPGFGREGEGAWHNGDSHRKGPGYSLKGNFRVAGQEEHSCRGRAHFPLGPCQRSSRPEPDRPWQGTHPPKSEIDGAPWRIRR